MPFEADDLAGLRTPQELLRIGLGVGRFAGAQVARRQAEQRLPIVAIDLASARVGVDERPGMEIVDENAVLGCLEDGAITGLGFAQGAVHPYTLELGRRAHGKDGENGLHHVGRGQWGRMADGEDTGRIPGRVQQGITRVTDVARRTEHRVGNEHRCGIAGVILESLREHARAGRAGHRVDERSANLAPLAHCQRRELRRSRCLIELRHESQVHPEHGGDAGDGQLEHLRAAGGGNAECHPAQRLDGQRPGIRRGLVMLRLRTHDGLPQRGSGTNM
jgi:hypothetical protein